ncbi:MAG: glycosyltransferase family 4 protein [Magnetococcales bacterium]|nr:glycosyltransferase family 4 protein [Magnetococcales bacterium]MBF0156757.1 glycosyltransferase family 4 protein [Magnetococcales bacterium]
MKIGIAGPILVEALRDQLEPGSGGASPAIRGLGGATVNLLVRGLLARGHEVVVFSLDPEVTREVVLRGPRLTLCLGPYRRRARWRALDLFRQERRYLSETIRRERPEVVHAHWTYEFALGALASGLPTLVTMRDWAPAVLRHYRDPYRLLRWVMDALTVRRSPYLTANSVYIQELIVSRWRRQVSVIPNPVEPGFFRQEEKLFPESDPVVVAVAEGFSRLKNQKSLMRAWPMIREEHPNCRLCWVGRDFERQGVAWKWAWEEGLDGGMEFAGGVSREGLKATLDRGALLVHPSLEESFGNAVVEAMARRLPVVGGGHSGAVPWILDHGDAGVLTDVTDPPTLARAVNALLSSREEWVRYSRKGYRRVQSHFSLSRVVEISLAEYARMLAPGS